MTTTVCVFAKTIDYPTAGGNLWAYLNWALGLRGLGCQVIWLEAVDPGAPPNEVDAKARTLRGRLERYGLSDHVALCPWTGQSPLPPIGGEVMDLEAAAEADLLINMGYGLPDEIVRRFRRSALVDIDPGLLQIWMERGLVSVARHDRYFTIGETVGRPSRGIPDLGVSWQHTPPCVALEWWPVHAPSDGACFTTVSQWYADEWVEDRGDVYRNDKRSGFLPFLDLPKATSRSIELALCLWGDPGTERRLLLEHGWRVRDADAVAVTPWDYQRYIQGSLAEFSCAKPSCVRLQNAWISDRTLCYLASGKPAVVQDTGPSRFLPDAAGLFRFRTLEDAARCLETVAADYERQCELARALAERYFDARVVLGRVLDLALT